MPRKRSRPVAKKAGASHKLWGGRFSSGPHPALDAVNRSIGVDFRLWPHDVRLSKAWASALAHADVLTEKESADGETLIRERTGNRSLVVFDRGDDVTVQAGEEGIRFLLVSGKPIEEPVAWYGPIVMNTQAELNQAVSELRNGTFIKK